MPGGEGIGQVEGRRLVVVHRGAGAGGLVVADGRDGRADGELRRPEDAVSAAHHGLRIQLVGEAEARPHLAAGGDADRVPAVAGVLHHAHRRDAGDIGRQRVGHRAVEVHHHAVVDFVQAGFMLPAQADVQGQPAADAEIVLHVEAVVVGDVGQLGGGVDGDGGRIAEQHVGQIGAAGAGAGRSGLGEDAVEIVIAGGIVGVVAGGFDLAIVEAGLQAVPAHVLRHVGGEVVGGVHVERIVVGDAQLIQVARLRRRGTGTALWEPG